MWDLRYIHSSLRTFVYSYFRQSHMRTRQCWKQAVSLPRLVTTCQPRWICLCFVIKIECATRSSAQDQSEDLLSISKKEQIHQIYPAPNPSFCTQVSLSSLPTSQLNNPRKRKHLPPTFLLLSPHFTHREIEINIPRPPQFPNPSPWTSFIRDPPLTPTPPRMLPDFGIEPVWDHGSGAVRADGERDCAMWLIVSRKLAP